MSKEMTEKSPFTGKPVTKDGYMNVDLAAKFADVTFDELDREARKKFGPLYQSLVRVADAAIAASQHLNEPRIDQLQTMNIAHVLLPIADVKGADLESEFVLYQVWLTKRANLVVEGIMEWDEYFVRSAEELVADAG